MSWAEQVKVLSGVDDIEAVYAADVWDAHRLGIRARPPRRPPRAHHPPPS